jgi:DNA-directed RNA polymerase III subunit RPC3
MHPSDDTPTGTSLTSSSQRHGKQQQPTKLNASISVSQQLLLQLGASMSNNNVVHPASKISSNNNNNNNTCRTITSVQCRSKHDPIVSLASHIIQTLFGSIVQTVANIIQCRGLLSLREIVSYLIPPNHSSLIPIHPSSHVNVNRITDGANSSFGRNHRNGISSSSSSQASVLTVPQIKAALLVLIQHSIISTTTKWSSAVTVSSNHTTSGSSSKSKRLITSTTLYRYHPIKAIYMNYRYAKFIEYIRKAMIGNSNSPTNSSDSSSSSYRLVEVLLLFGRLRTVDLIMHTIQRIIETPLEASSEESHVTAASQQQMQVVIEVFSTLVTAGFIVPSRVLSTNNDDDMNDDNELENEWSDTNAAVEGHPQKRMKWSNNTDQIGNTHYDVNISTLYQGDALSVALLLTKDNSYQQTLPINTLWTVNTAMFHDHLRAYFYGKYISERYGKNHFRGNTTISSSSSSSSSNANSQSSFACIGSLITAALKYRAYRTYAMTDPHVCNNHGVSYFTVADIMKYIPKSVIQIIEKNVGENGGSASNVESSIEQILCDLCSLNHHPHFLRRISDSYHGNDDRKSQEQIAFEVVLPTISNDYIDRIIYQVVHDRHGAIAARVVSILTVKGYLESDRIADIAMVPAKDTREVLHHLYRSRYVELLQLSNSSRQQYNPNNAIYLWGIERPRLIQRMIDDIAKALYNLQLRRQHEIETIGAEWLVRTTTNQHHPPYSHDQTNNFTTNVENLDLNITNSVDRENYTRFCIGLERIDVASIQLDETLMALFDFPKILH